MCIEKAVPETQEWEEGRPGQQNKSEVDEVEGSRCLQNRVPANCKNFNKMGREMAAFEEADPRQPFLL